MKCIAVAVLAVLATAACSKDPNKDAPTPSPSTVTSAQVALAASAASSASASPLPPGTANGTQLDGVNCRVRAGATTMNLHFRFTLMKGTLLVDGPETRRIFTKATPSGGTYILQFVSYETGDTKPVGETLTPASVVARIVSNGDHDDVYFDGDVHPAGTSPTVPLRCE